MLLGVNSGAAPDASVAELVAACNDRGLQSIELSVPAACDLEQLTADAREACDGAVGISGIIVESPSYAHQLARSSRAFHAPVLVTGIDSMQDRVTLACSVVAHGGTALPVLSGPATEWLDLIVDAAVPFAWQIDDSCIDPAGDAAAILETGAMVSYIRLVGGGPEAVMHEGRGLGTLMTRLTLSGYAGPLILVPSSRAYRVVWARWLGRRGGWGCGSKSDSENTKVFSIHA